MKMDSNDTNYLIADDVPIKKRPYFPPVLSLIETEDIAGGVQNLQEADGDGFLS